MEAVIPDPVAVVEGVEIKKAELESALTAILAQRGQSPAALPPEQKPSIYRMVLDDLIIDKLVSKRAQEMKVEDAEVDEMIAKLKKNFGSDEEFNAQVEKMGQTVEKVKENIRMNLRQQHWVDEQVKGKVEVTEAEAKDFYEKNGDQFKQPEQVRASHFLIAVPQDAKPDVVAEKEKAAKAALARVQKGEAFDKVTKEVSDDPGSKEKGGDLGFFGREQMVPEFSEAAFKLKKDEVTAEPVRSQFGYHVIKLTERKDAEKVSFEKAQPQLMTYLQNQKKQKEIEKVVMEMRAKAEVKVNLPEVPTPAAAGAPGAAPAAPAAK